jgi:NAD(P)-dependent dehydrogenase (short-subunit alcohol dehydrogenase family)
LTTTLITGANKGLGYETARRLRVAGHDVWIGARNPDAGRAAAARLGAHFVHVDVTDDETLIGAATLIGNERGALDVLVNNAGISGVRKLPESVTAADMQLVFDTNVFGIVRTMHAFLPLLHRSDNPVVVNVSSGMGSLAITTDPRRLESSITGIAYPSSKAAVSMLTSQYAKAFPALRINAVDPGHTATDFNNHNGTQTVEEGVEIIVTMACIGKAGPTGTFSDRNGTVPW